MPATPRTKVIGRYFELPIDLDRRLRDYAESVGSTYAAEVRSALERHLLYPPDRRPDPLPDAARKKS